MCPRIKLAILVPTITALTLITVDPVSTEALAKFIRTTILQLPK